MERDLAFFMNKKYRVSLHYDPDGYWIAEHPELPGCIADGETAQEALSSLDVSRELWIESRLATGLEVPEPQEEPQYSGKFVLRIAKSLHRELAKEADSEGVSLNTHLSNLLAGRNSRVNQITPEQETIEGIVSNVLATCGFVQQGSPALPPQPYKLGSSPNWGQPQQNSLVAWKKESQMPWKGLGRQNSLYFTRTVNSICATSHLDRFDQESFGQHTSKPKNEAPYEC